MEAPELFLTGLSDTDEAWGRLHVIRSRRLFGTVFGGACFLLGSSSRPIEWPVKRAS